MSTENNQGGNKDLAKFDKYMLKLKQILGTKGGILQSNRARTPRSILDSVVDDLVEEDNVARAAEIKKRLAAIVKASKELALLERKEKAKMDAIILAEKKKMNEEMKSLYDMIEEFEIDKATAREAVTDLLASGGTGEEEKEEE